MVKSMERRLMRDAIKREKNNIKAFKTKKKTDIVTHICGHI